LTWTYSENLHRRATIEILATGFLEALRGLIRHCLSPDAGGLTPSDFPEVGLRQRDLDQLLAQIGREGLSIESVVPLSPLQQGMLFHSLYAPGSGVYVVQWSVRLEGRIEGPLFQRAWQRVVDRHSALRTSFHWQGLEKPVQVVYRRIPLTLAHTSWRRLPAAEQQTRLAGYLDADRKRGFDLTVAPLMRLALFELDEDVWRFVWSFHHLYIDGWSSNLVLNEVFRCYEAFSEGREVGLAPCRSYRRYIAWLGKQDLEQAKRYWQGLLAGFTVPTLLVSCPRNTYTISPALHAPG
ncbi:MAG: non-ribosomal peptide synthetase, partial [bacterium]|nr:non-ribosomal peptide synthetase [bacterium]